MTGQQPRPGWQATDRQPHALPLKQRGSIPPGQPRTQRKDADARNDDGDSSSLMEFMKALQELLKTIRAFIAVHKVISGVGITIVIIVVAGTIRTTPPPPYPAAVQQGWLSDCESRSFNTAPKCECELSYFENHVKAEQFEQDYSEMPPGVVPPELAGAEACPS
jgi:hypothetical protein